MSCFSAFVRSPTLKPHLKASTALHHLRYLRIIMLRLFLLKIHFKKHWQYFVFNFYKSFISNIECKPLKNHKSKKCFSFHKYDQEHFVLSVFLTLLSPQQKAHNDVLYSYPCVRYLGRKHNLSITYVLNKYTFMHKKGQESILQEY